MHVDKQHVWTVCNIRDGSGGPMEISADAPAGPAEDRTLSEMIEFLKTENAQCF